MTDQASVTGLIRTVLIIIGVLFLLRLLGRVMLAKKEMDKENRRRRQERAFEKEKANKLKNFGKVTISDKSKPDSDEEYVDYEEVN